MRQWSVVITVVVFVLVGSIMVVLFAPGLLLSHANSLLRLSTQATKTTSNVIMSENAQSGTSKWKIPVQREASIQIQAYAGATSVSVGQTITFYVSTEYEGVRYSVDIYRMGWYGGSGGRLMALTVTLTGHAQGYYNLDTQTLVDCHSCRINSKVGLVEANWQPSYTVEVPPDWVTGVYLAKFTELQHGLETYVPFDVLGNTHSQYVVCTADTTYAAYNDWGGVSLYDADSSAHIGENAALPRGQEVSFDRPYTSGQGSSQVLVYEINAIRWMERQGYDLSYISSVDLHTNPGQLLQHRAYLSIGHDEYWTKEMRDGVEYARDQGVNLAFLGADAAYWQMRLGQIVLVSRIEPLSVIKCHQTMVHSRQIRSMVRIILV